MWLECHLVLNCPLQLNITKTFTFNKIKSFISSGSYYSNLVLKVLQSEVLAPSDLYFITGIYRRH
jgi:hypothetical protein